MDASLIDRTPRTQRGQRTLRKLLDAAAEEFGARGYHDAAITGITTRAGVALGSFYTYFESKEAVFRALVSDMSHRVRAHVTVATEPATDRIAAERLGLAAFIAFVRDNRGLYRIIEEAQFVAPDAYRQHYDRFAEGYRRGLAAARGRGELRDGDDEARAWALIGMSVFLGLRYGVRGADLSPEEVAAAATDLIAHGMARPGA